MIGLVLVSGLALAAPPGCDAPYDADAWVRAMDRADEALAAGDLQAARPDLLEAHRRVLCLEAGADPLAVGRLARQLALAFFFEQDEESVRRWGLLSRAVEELPWDDTFAPGHPFRAMLDEAEVPPVSGPDADWIVPRKGTVLLNGAPRPVPQAPAEVPGLLQVLDRRGEVLEAWWVHGSAFPEAILGPPNPKVRKALAKHRPAPSRPTPTPAQPAEPATADAPETHAPASPPPEPPPALSAREYVDPFSDARRRALSREVSERELTGESGVIGVVRTEVMTLPPDPSGGKTVTQALFAQWLQETPEWAPGGLMARHRGGEGYLQGWTGAQPPTPDRPVTSVSWAAASAYCGSWGNQVAAVDQGPPAQIAEWRRGPDGPVVMDRAGTVVKTDPEDSPSEVGFRCAP